MFAKLFMYIIVLYGNLMLSGYENTTRFSEVLALVAYFTHDFYLQTTELNCLSIPLVIIALAANRRTIGVKRCTLVPCHIILISEYLYFNMTIYVTTKLCYIIIIPYQRNGSMHRFYCLIFHPLQYQYMVGFLLLENILSIRQIISCHLQKLKWFIIPISLNLT